jgi:hypothetical protein
LKTMLTIWRRGWDLNPVGALKARKLLILRAAPDAGTARTALVGYSLGTDSLARLASRLLLLLVLHSPPLALAQCGQFHTAIQPADKTNLVRRKRTVRTTARNTSNSGTDAS